MEKRTVKKFKSILKRAPRINEEKMQDALAEVREGYDAYERSLRLLGDVKLTETHPVTAEGFCYFPRESVAALGADGALYGNYMTSNVVLFGVRQLYVYSRVVCLTGKFVEERLADFYYEDIVGLDMKKQELPYKPKLKPVKPGKEKKKKKEKKYKVTIPTVECSVLTKSGAYTFPLPGDVECENLARLIREEIRSKK